MDHPGAAAVAEEEAEERAPVFPGKSVILLADRLNCDNALAVAFYLSRAYETEKLTILLYDFMEERVAKYSSDSVGRGDAEDPGAFTLQFGLFAVDKPDLPGTVRTALTPASPNAARGPRRRDGADAEEAEPDTLFKRVHAFSRLIDALKISVLNPGAFDASFADRGRRIISELLALTEETCFIIAPNGRDIPFGLLSYSHKLTASRRKDGLTSLHYTPTSTGASERFFHDDVTAEQAVRLRDDAIKVFCEISLCRAIHANPKARYVGNCYGSQVMWIALGRGVTGFRRRWGDRRADPVELDLLPVESPLKSSASADEGIFGSTRVATAGEYPQEELEYGLAVNRLGYDGHRPVIFNTDYHHSYLLVTFVGDSLDVGKDIYCGGHSFAELFSAREDLDRDRFPCLYRVQKLARDAAEMESRRAQIKASQKSGAALTGKVAIKGARRGRLWVGYYCAAGRIFAFQGHPLYHVTDYSAGWAAPSPSRNNGDAGVNRNPHYEGNKDMIWRMFFGPPPKKYK